MPYGAFLSPGAYGGTHLVQRAPEAVGTRRARAGCPGGGGAIVVISQYLWPHQDAEGSAEDASDGRHICYYTQ